MLFALILTFAAVAASHPTQHTHHHTKRRSYPNGIATFNNYAAQGNTNCGPSSGQPGTYGAAASDISPDISGGMCSGNLLMSHCAGQSVGPGYQAPGCPKTNCGKCYKVTNRGGIGGGSIGAVGKSIIVQIIDACPSKSAYNFCKTDVPVNQRCGDSKTNQLDIDHSAYMALTGQAFGSGPTLNIDIEDAECSEATGTGGTDSGSGVSAASPPSSSNDLNAGLPGQHAAGGDKLAKHVEGGNLAIQGLGSTDSSPVTADILRSSTTSPPLPTPTTTSAAPPVASSVTPSEDPSEGDLEDEECDEL